MPNNKNKKQKLNKSDKLKIVCAYFLSILVLVSLFLVISKVAINAYIKNLPKPPEQVFENKDISENNEENSDEDKTETIEKPTVNKAEKVNFLIVGTDASDGLTDVILVGCFNKDKSKIDIISIPRDTYIDFSDETVSKIKSKGHAEGLAIKKVNGIYGMTGRDIKYLEDELEKLLNIKFDYYAVINIEAFRKIVDDVGGIEMTLKRNYYYYDPTQDLLINLKAGKQILKGKQAEQFVRYRNDYPGGDIDRIEVQQLFMKEFFSQVLNKETIINNAFSMLTTFITYVKTDFGIDDLPKYASSIASLKGDNFSFTTLPGTDKKIDGYFYYLKDSVETAKLINKIFYSDDSNLKDSKDLKVKIYNSTTDTSLGAQKKDQLVLNGYQDVSYTSSYNGKKLDNTIIYVNEIGLGEDLIKFFNSASVEVTEDVSDDYDIKIVLGSKEE